jgi:uncharacterized protein YbjT (DUF2867 family)
MLDSSRQVVAVHGATGVQGAAIARRLLDHGHRVRAVARHPDPWHGLLPGCESCAADLMDADALAYAYAGADAVVVQLPLVFDERAVIQAERVAEALHSSEVRRVVFNTGGPTPSEPVGLPYLDARTLLAGDLEGGPFSATVLEPVAGYMEHFSASWSAPLVREGVLAFPLSPDACVPWVALDDVADQIAAALAGDEPPRMQICGPAPLTGEQAADTLGRALGRSVQWTTLDPGEYADMLRPYTGDQIADGLAATLSQAPPQLRPDPALLRVGGTDLEAWARSLAWAHAGVLAAAA